jgi:hypothetical protein
MPRKVKQKKHENLSDSNIKRVIQLLSAKDSITKKEACEILNIAYNTSRLNSIIEGYKDKQNRRQEMLKKKRGTPASDSEIANIVESYLGGEGFAEISKRVFRSTGFVKSVIERVGVPDKPSGDDKFEVGYLPEECVSYEFSVGEIAWSSRHHSSCEILSELEEKYKTMYGCPAYRVWINEPSETGSAGYNAFIAAYDLGKLSHLEKYGLNTSRL